MLMPRLLRRSRPRGFTLVEALVAIGLTTILLWGLLQLYSSATAFSSTVTVEAELCSAGRAVLERMVRELNGAVYVDRPAPTPDLGYMKISRNKVSEEVYFDAIQFVTAAAEGDKLVHIKYHATGTGSSRALKRAVNDSASPSNSTATDGAEGDPFGLNVESIKIEYLKSNGTQGSSYGSLSSVPMAINIEIRFSDRKNRATIALTSSAFLPGSGL